MHYNLRWSVSITQGVEMRRRSEITVDVVTGTDSEIEQIQLSGSVREVMRGELVVPTGEL